jgi:1-acyl-sn-glycerol-3-phosphate acyltransferase
MLKMVSTLIFKVSGWALEGNIPEGMDKCVMVVAPHTSNIDFFFGLAVVDKLRLPIRYLIKQEWLNKLLIGRLFVSTGAVGVVRSERQNMVGQMADYLAGTKQVALVFPPEGTRKRNARWKTGFYYVALQAGVPIVLAALDYGRKKVVIGPSFVPSGDFPGDMEQIRHFYGQVRARRPEKFALPQYDPPGQVVSP